MLWLMPLLLFAFAVLLSRIPSGDKLPQWFPLVFGLVLCVLGKMLVQQEITQICYGFVGIVLVNVVT